MPFNINELSSLLNYSGTYSTAHFNVIIPVPTSVGMSDREVSARCLATQLPGINLNTQPTQNYGFGVTQELPYEALFDQVTLNFIVDEFLDLNDFFHKWMLSAVNFNERDFSRQKSRFSYPDEYMSDINILTYNKAGEPAMDYTLHQAYPKTVQAIDVAWANQNDFAILSVAFAYKSWTTDRFESSSELSYRPLKPTIK